MDCGWGFNRRISSAMIALRFTLFSKTSFKADKKGAGCLEHPRHPRELIAEPVSLYVTALRQSMHHVFLLAEHDGILVNFPSFRLKNPSPGKALIAASMEFATQGMWTPTVDRSLAETNNPTEYRIPILDLGYPFLLCVMPLPSWVDISSCFSTS
ncbi:hypothetical protein BJX68DRAFT_214248 [Aspergillus pseudodeflectus]|uniref:Uncharacterized protein n=1 Tax=Aspergillus pseudodeflectus TaxID=176178 RepID=A0ABR4JGH5_9EURO